MLINVYARNFPGSLIAGFFCWSAKSARQAAGSSVPNSFQLNAFAHRNVLLQPIKLFAIGLALGCLRGKRFRDLNLVIDDAEALLQLSYPCRERNQGIGERVLDVVGVSDQHALAVSIDNVRRHSD